MVHIQKSGMQCRPATNCERAENKATSYVTVDEEFESIH